jgi:hypothetical protein
VKAACDTADSLHDVGRTASASFWRNRCTRALTDSVEQEPSESCASCSAEKTQPGCSASISMISNSRVGRGHRPFADQHRVFGQPNLQFALMAVQASEMRADTFNLEVRAARHARQGHRS